ncbi:serine hydrolase domain-containing protein [Kitasatospora sp. NPDC058162]|uniref:serine hydrolase domain-containing protein n=1 Tax=Kitasatospora sp. NPDC058162 TaxID=3346362 RepID=UPI0036DD23BA
MNAYPHRTRWAVVAAGALAAALTVGAGTPALAAVPGTATASAGTSAVPPLDPAAVRAALAKRPAADVSAAFVRITGSTGRFEDSSAEDGMAVDTDGRYRIGSVSKIFTATVVLQLAAEGRVDLDGDVRQYLPDFPYQGVTVGQLLNHTSGLPNGTNVPWGDGTTTWFEAHRYDSFTPEQVLATMAGQPLGFTPGTEQQYNGMNTFVAGLIVEKVTGHRYADELRRRIIRPLGLHDTSLPDGDDPGLRHPATRPYLTVPDADGGSGSHRVDVTEQSPWPWAEGGMISSAPDLDRFITALFRGRLLPAAEQEKLFTVPDVPVAPHSGHCPDGKACMSMGLERLAAHGVVAWGKTGSRPGSTGGVFATRDLSRKVVYTVDPTALNGAETPYVLGLVASSFGLGSIV